MAFRKLELTKLDLGPVGAVPEGIAAVMALTEQEALAIESLSSGVEPMSNAHRRGRSWRCSPTFGTKSSTSGTQTITGQ